SDHRVWPHSVRVLFPYNLPNYTAWSDHHRFVQGTIPPDPQPQHFVFVIDVLLPILKALPAKTVATNVPPVRRMIARVSENRNLSCVLHPPFPLFGPQMNC